LWTICSAPAVEIDAAALELWLAENPVTTAGAPMAITAPAKKASKPPAAAVPMGTGRLIIAVTFNICSNLLIGDRLGVELLTVVIPSNPNLPPRLRRQ
jgi:hypothetical protein